MCWFVRTGWMCPEGFITKHELFPVYVCFISLFPTRRISGHNLFRNYCMHWIPIPQSRFEPVSGRKWHLPWVLLDMQQVQISLDLPFPRKINSDTLGSELHPIVPCLHAFSEQIWVQPRPLIREDWAGSYRRHRRTRLSESRSRNKPNEEEMERTSWGKERVSRETRRGLCSSPEAGCWNTMWDNRILYRHIPELWPYYDIIL